MTKKVKILEINRKQKTSQRTGKPYTSVGIKIQGKNGPVWVNGFENATTKGWVQGAEVEIELERNGNYWNFKPVPVDFGKIMTLLEAIAVKLEVGGYSKITPAGDPWEDDIPPPPVDEDMPGEP